MQTDRYKESLKETWKTLQAANEDIFQSMIHVLTQGELKQWNKEVPIGEVHQFDWEIFKNSDDTNIQLLVKVMENVDNTYQSIKNINAIKLDEEEWSNATLPPSRQTHYRPHHPAHS